MQKWIVVTLDNGIKIRTFFGAGGVIGYEERDNKTLLFSADGKGYLVEESVVYFDRLLIPVNER